jgi:DNA-binding transcriptional regulator/RsmH inhibitor MraZ
MSSSSKTYRIYSYDGAQKVVTADLIEATSDEEAIAAVGSGSKFEIWDGRRLVAQLESERRLA